MLRPLFLSVIALIVFAPPANAACSGPLGNAGDIVFNSDYHIMQYCDNTNWITMGASKPFSSDTGCLDPVGVAGDMFYNGAQRLMQYCNGEEWIGVGDSSANACTGGGTCASPSGNEGDMLYNADHGVMQYCNGNAWISMKGEVSKICNTSACPATGLVGYWPFNEGSGAVAYDATGNNNNGAITGATWSSGKFGGALNFDGVDDFVVIPDAATLRGDQDLTIALWIKPVSGTGQQKFITKSWNGSDKDWELSMNTTNRFYWESEVSGSGYLQTSPVNSFMPAKWSHVAAVLNKTGDILTLYVDGAQVGQDTTFGANSDGTHASTINVGRRYYSGGGTASLYFPGEIDDIRIYNRALSAPEIASIYNGGGGCP